ncbi:MAG: GDP-mannose 4,6-dehydratase [Anaerolineae bacterium]
MKSLVTGGAGFIGSHVVDRLLADGHDVYVVDNLSTGKIENVQHHLQNDRFHLVNDTILNETLMDRIISQVDMVFHLAATVGVWHIMADPLNSVLTNVQGTEVILKYAYKYWKKVVFASTSEIYGKSQRFPFNEDDDRVLGPTQVHRWSYSTAKAIDEHLAFAYHDKGLPVVILRYFNSYGPRMDPRGYGSVVAKFISQALRGKPITVHGDGQQTRCFTFIDDTVQGTVLAATKPAAEGEVFNIGRSRETSILQLAETIQRLAGPSSEITFIPYTQAYGEYFEDTLRRVPDVSKAEEVLGFKAEVPLEEGLKKTVEWFRQGGLPRLESVPLEPIG